MKKLINYFVWATIAVALGLAILMLFWLNYPYRIIEFDSDKFSVDRYYVRQGQVIVFDSNYCKYTDLSAGVYRIFKNDIIFHTPKMIGNIKKGCSSVSVAVPIPKELPPGEYVIENVYEYQVNPIRSIVIRHDTEPFYVTE